MKAKPEMKPCPFCGAAPYKSDRFEKVGLLVWDVDHTIDCFFSYGNVIYPDSLKKWNHRHATTPTHE